LLIAVAGGSLVNTVIKATLHRARPGDMAYHGWSEFSFPSGHSTINAILYGFLAVLIAREVRASWRLPTAFLATMVAISIAFSRVYLGAHWFSDVAAGLSFGTLWLAAVSLVLLRGRRERVGSLLLASVAGLALLIAGGLNIRFSHPRDVERYAIRHPISTITEQAWLDGGWKRLADRRIDLTGEEEEPFTLQIAGSLPEIERQLATKGWRRPSVFFPNLAAWLSPDTGPDELPVFPLLASGRAPELVMIATDVGAVNGRIVLRLWRSELAVSDANGNPVWLGSAIHERVATFAWLATRTMLDSEYSGPRDVAAAAFENVVQVTDEKPLDGWDGRIILVNVHPDAEK
jgi:hypothetical protein